MITITHVKLQLSKQHSVATRFVTLPYASSAAARVRDPTAAVQACVLTCNGDVIMKVTEVTVAVVDVIVIVVVS